MQRHGGRIRHELARRAGPTEVVDLLLVAADRYEGGNTISSVATAKAAKTEINQPQQAQKGGGDKEYTKVTERQERPESNVIFWPKFLLLDSIK